MGSAPSATTVSVLADGEQPGPFSIRRCPGFSEGPFKNPPGKETMQDLILFSYANFPNNPYIGHRKRIDGQLAKEFTFITYKEAEEIAYNIGSGLIHGLGIKPQGFVGVYSENRTEWVNMIDVSALYGHVVVSLYDTFGTDLCGQLIKHSKMTTIMVSTKNAPKLLKILENDQCDVKNVILFTDQDASYAEIADGFKQLKTNFYTFADILEIGKENRQPIPKVQPEWIHYVCYSSGTTGVPKGVLISHRSQCSNTLNCKWGLKFDENSHHLSYLPLAHVFERIGISITSYVGGRIGFFSGSIPQLTEDMRILQPTHLSAVPRVINRIYDQVMSQINKSSKVKQSIFWGCWYWKRFWLKRGYQTPLADSLVFDQINGQIGGKIRQFIVGGAMMDPWIHEFIQFATAIPMRVGYGLTEIGAGNIVNPFDVRFSKPGTVGGPMCNCEVRLDPLPDYDDPLCGEIIMGGQCNCSGYLFDDEATANLFLEQSHWWVHTGDVGKWDNDGYLMVVDRIRSIFKLSQGEYVAAELLTQTYENAPIVEQIFIYGDSSRTCLVAIVLPSKANVAKFLGKKEITDEEFTKACETAALKAEVKTQLDRVASEKNLPGYERIRNLICVNHEWSISNDLMTPTFKLKRKKLSDKYKDVIDILYESI